MYESLITGLFLGFSLIIAIGPQNIFVLRQGILKEHVFLVAFFFALLGSIPLFTALALSLNPSFLPCFTLRLIVSSFATMCFP